MPQQYLLDIAVRHAAHLEGLKASEIKKFDKFLIEMDRDIRRKLSLDITEFSRTRLEKQIKAISALMKDRYSDYKKVWMSSIEDFSKYESGFEARALGRVVKGVSFSLPSQKQVLAAVFNTPLGDIGGADGGKILESFLDGATSKQIERVEGAIRLGYAQGETTPQIVRRIRGTKAAGFSDGVLARSKREIETVTRTALQHAANQSRNAVWEENQDVISGVRIVATLDEKTSSICRALDGQVYPLDKGPRPPFHPNCRTTTAAELADKYAGLSAGRTRVARDPETGKIERVSAKHSYYGWLKNQPAGVQDSIIGPTRGKLLRNGGISADRFAELQLGKNFQINTLEQMRELEPIAFTRANL